jgi:translocation-and-assembly-module (TAM) inner membrane subunit TamB-like protein
MARRWLVRSISWIGIAIGAVVAFLLVVLLLTTQTSYGRERVRQLVVRFANQQLAGALYVGALRFGPGCALSVDSVVIRDPDKAVLLELGLVRATCRFDALIRGRLMLTSLDVSNPRVVVQQSSGGVWNWSRVVRNDTTPPPPPDSLPQSPGTTRLIVNGPIRISDGNVVLEVPGMPRRVLSGFTFDAPLVRTELPGLSVMVDLREMSAELSEPFLVLHRLSGSITVVGDSAEIDLPFISVSQSTVHIRGWVDWGRPGMPAMAMTIKADSLAFSDVAWLAPEIPADGSGRFEVALSSGGGGSPLLAEVRSVDLRAMRSIVRGSFSARIDSAPRLAIQAARIEAVPLHTDLLRRVAPNALPPELRGSLTARLVATGTNRERLHIDTLDARYADETGAGGTSRITAYGDVELDNSGSAATLQVRAQDIDARTIARAVPSLPLQGMLRGTMSVNASPSAIEISRADLQYTEGDSTLRLTGGGRITLDKNMAIELKVDAQPLAPSALGVSFPSLASFGSFTGPLELRGTPDDLSITAGLHNPGGSIALAARYRTSTAGVAITGTARVRNADPRLISGLATGPSGKLDADLTVDLSGDSIAALRGTAELSQLAGTIGGVAIEPSVARFSLTDSRVVAESVSIATSAGAIRAQGSIGRRSTSRDTLTVMTTMSLASLRPLFRELMAQDSTTADTMPSMLDSASGTITANARLTGSIDSLHLDTDVEGTRVSLASLRISRMKASASLALHDKPRGRVSLVADSLELAGSPITRLTASATSRDDAWLVRLGTSPDDARGGEATGSIALRADTVDIGLDSLRVHVPGAALELARPTRIRTDSSGIAVLDTVELRGTRGALIRLSGAVHDTGAIAVSLDVSNVTIHLPGLAVTEDSIRTRLDAHAELGGTAAEPRAMLRARVRLIDADSIALDSVLADVSHERGGTSVRVTAHADERSFFVAQATLPLNLSLTPFKAEVRDDSISGEITIDSIALAEVTRLIPGVRATSGVLRSHVTLAGTMRHLRADGTTELQDGAAHIAALGISVHHANAKVAISSERLTVSGASVRAGEKPEGRLEVSGFIGFGDSATSDLRLRSSYMPVMRLAEFGDLDVSSDLRLAGPSGRPTASGSITVDRGVIRLPELGSAGVVGVDDTAFVRLVDSLAPARAARPPGMSAAERLEIGKIDVVMGPNVWLRSSEASIQVGGRIGLERATTAPGDSAPRIALRGALITQRGNYRFSVGHISRLFELEEGSVTFTGEPELNPRLDINALYQREGYDVSQGSSSSPSVRLHVGGTLERPSLTFSSADAKLSQSELMSYLITGQTHFALGDVNEGAVSSELVASATGALAQRVAGGLFDVVNVTAGSTTTASSENRSAAANVFASSRLGVGKQLSNRVFLKVDAGLCALAGGNGSNDLWQSFGVSLDYRFRRGLLGSLSSAPSTNGANCSNQAAGRGTALAPRQWGFDFNRTWRF